MTTRLTRRLALAGGLAALGGAGIFAVAQERAEAPARTRRMPPVRPTTLDIEASPLDRFAVTDASHRRFGDLRFLSGAVLTSPNRRFGGLSSLLVRADGALLACSDVGEWFSARLVHDAEGRIAGVKEASLSPLLASDGRQLRELGRWDTESLAMDARGIAYVGVERVNEIWRFDFGRDGVAARGAPIATPASFKRLPDNKGPEALGVIPQGSPHAGALVAISERAFGQGDVTQGFLLGPQTQAEFRYVRHDEFDVSDLAFLPDGDMLVLERRFRWTDGVAIRIRRVPLASIKPGAILSGRLVFDADMRHEIDNFEGLSVHVDASGRTIVTLVSDDNFQWLQRTLLLQFQYMD